MIKGSDKIAKAAAEMMDRLDEDFPEAEIAVDEVLIGVELTLREGGEDWCRVEIKCSHASPVYRAGLADAVLTVVTSTGSDDDE